MPRGCLGQVLAVRARRKIEVRLTPEAKAFQDGEGGHVRLQGEGHDLGHGSRILGEGKRAKMATYPEERSSINPTTVGLAQPAVS